MKSLLLIVICGCEPLSQVGAQNDAQPAGDAAAIANTCGGTGDSFVYSGAVEAFQAYDFGMVTSNGLVVGFAGSALDADVLAFNTRQLAEIDSVGDHDVATENITGLRAPFNVSCDVGNTVCHGFYAQAGTFTVHATHPRYQATFALSNLFERTDNSSPPGTAIAGSITGCVDKVNP
jgi:hypothetical protein